MSFSVSLADKKHYMRGMVLPLIIILAWEVGARLELINVKLLIPPGVVLETIFTAIQSGDFWSDVEMSATRMLLGFALGAGGGLLVGSAMGLSRTLDKLVGPSFHAVRQIAVFAWIPLIAMLFGLGEPAKIVFIGIVAFFPVVLNTHEGIRSVSKEYVEVATVFTFSRYRLLKKVILPGATSSIFTGIELAIIYAWLATIGAEYLMTSTGGIGALLLDGREHFRMDIVLLGIITTGLVGWIVSCLTRALRSHLLRWRIAA
jgi:sulfonate transport system permease protein